MGQGPKGGKSCGYPTHTGIGVKAQTFKEKEKEAVKFKTETSVAFLYDLPVQILGGERDGTGQETGVYVLKRDPALM